MAHVSEFFSVCSRTAASTACLTGGGTSFGSRPQKIYGRMVLWSARSCDRVRGVGLTSGFSDEPPYAVGYSSS